MSDPTPPSAAHSLSPKDFEVLMRLLPRATITVADIPQIYPTLAAVERASSSGKSYFVERTPEA